jgi:hypothetical protein
MTEGNDRRRQEWSNARATLELPPSIERKREGAVRSIDLIAVVFIVSN